MIHVITSNFLKIRNADENFGDSILCDVAFRIIPPRVEPVLVGEIFHGQNASSKDFFDYRDDSTVNLRFTPSSSLNQGVLRLGEIFLSDEKRAKATAKAEFDTPEEMIVAVACDYSWNRKIADMLAKKLRSSGSSIIPMNVYDSLKMPGIEQLTNFIKSRLGSECVYPEDPLAFGYALYLTFTA